ncbi:MAG: glycosyltransferase family 4 protein [Ignavibacteriaceae bacterium]|nr:glycosyltransferase family 4 protein [Ignavibacteriaceae bacterium]
MRVLFLMFVFPDMNTSFNMYTALVEEFVRNGHEIYVLAPGIGSTGIKVENGIKILRVKTLPIKNVPNFLKGISNILLPFQFKKALHKFYPRVQFDLIISATPPITLVDLASRLKKEHNSKFYLILRDIFPQNAVDLGIMKGKSILHLYFRSKERKLYRVADFIGCMSQGNIDYIIRHNPLLSGNKLHILHNYQKLYEDYEISNTNILREFNIENKFVVVFGGNMGKSQQLENVLKLAKDCEEYHDVEFILLGEGVQIKKIEMDIKKQNIRNIKLMGTISKQKYQTLISRCQLGLISLHQDFTIPNIPSKTLDYFNVGIPVLASIDKATDYNKVLDEAKAGLWSYAGDHQSFKSNFDKLYRDSSLRKTMGANGRRYFEKFLTAGLAYESIIKTIS